MKVQHFFIQMAVAQSLCLLLSSARADDAAPNTLTDAEKQAGWKLLFDGQTTKGWRNYKKDGISAGWKVEDGALSCNKGGDIVTVDPYSAFELVLDYNIGKAGNSGLMFHVSEEYQVPWMTGPEIQIQDNKDGHDPQLSGWLYQLYKPPMDGAKPLDATKPAGEWNQIRFLCTPEKSSVWMNGQKYYDFVKGSDDWNQKVAASKFAKMPKFGQPTSGHIDLQDHGDPVKFRNIKIRVIDTK